MPDLLFELHVEELPASYLDKAIEGLRARVASKLSELRVLETGGGGEPRVRVTGTPRRIAVHVAGLRAEQKGSSEELIGPPVSAAFKDGKPTKAAEAFAAKLGIAVERIEQRETPKGRYLVGTKNAESRPTASVLPGALVELLAGIEFPKSMTWVPGSKLRFARPLRSIVALLDAEVVPVEWNGVRSGRATEGHPFLAPGKLELRSASWDDYARALRERKVVVDRDERRAQIARLVKAHLASGEPNAAIVNVSANLVEWPEVMTGAFDERFLEIPPGVIVAAIQGHLRAFPLKDAHGKLSSKFAFVCNRPANDLIRKGNERVLRARLSDAHFFYEKDQKTPLVENVARLEGVVFQRDLGSYAAKQERVARIARRFVEDQASRDQTWATRVETSAQAASLMKADLVTEIVGEFPELQGEVGAVYARKQGLPEEVAEAIREAYLPRGEGDSLPETRTGIALSIAEKLDNTVAAFATGMKPTGSKDPLGVRRQVIGMLRILREKKIPTGLSLLLTTAAAQLPEGVFASRKKEKDGKPAPAPDSAAARKALVSEVREFVKGRLVTMAQDEGHRADLLEAVFRAGFDDVPDLWVRLAALEKLAQLPRFRELVLLVERSRNITKGVGAAEPVEAALREPAEKELFQALLVIRHEIDALLGAREYVKAGELYERQLTAPVERFMKEVFVNDKDEAIKKNRLALMKSVHGLLAERFADLAEVAGKPA